ncbi:MAG TPA: hypothetical protein VGK86_12325 [Thermoanaerobaculia bacterium]|jgi:hypothetical protein
MSARRKAACVTVLSTAAAVAFAALMQHSETTIPLPAPGEKTTLKRLEYRARFVASIDSVTLQRKSEPGADPVVTEWVFTGSNTDGQAHRVEIVVRLLNEAGAQIGVFSTRRVIPPGAHEIEISLATKVRPDAWSSAKKVRIFADWMS